MISIVVGLVEVVLFDALSVGMIHQMLDNQIGAHISHLQIHSTGFNDNKLLQNTVPNAEVVEKLNLCSRYQTATENRIYRALGVLKQLKTYE